MLCVVNRLGTDNPRVGTVSVNPTVAVAFPKLKRAARITNRKRVYLADGISDMAVATVLDGFYRMLAGCRSSQRDPDVFEYKRGWVAHAPNHLWQYAFRHNKIHGILTPPLETGL